MQTGNVLQQCNIISAGNELSRNLPILQKNLSNEFMHNKFISSILDSSGRFSCLIDKDFSLMVAGLVDV